MVHTSLVMRAFRTPALHFLLLGGLLYAGVTGYKIWQPSSFTEPTQLIIPRYQLERAKQEFFESTSRLPTTEEQQTIYNTLVDQEVLYSYALQLGLNKQAVVERRLAQVASFVEENQDEPQSQEQLALQAMKLGLGEGDLVVRRILIDGARRLIRAAALVRIPSEEMLQAYLQDNPTQFQRPAEIRLTQITFNLLAHGENTEKKAKEVLYKLQKKPISLEQAVKLGDDFWIPSSLPLLNDQELIRHFDYDFAVALKTLPLHAWSNPIPSRYGLHLVMIHERRSPYVPPLAEIRKAVQRRLLQKMADEWLALRLQQLRQEFKVVMQ